MNEIGRQTDATELYEISRMQATYKWPKHNLLSFLIKNGLQMSFT